MEAFLKKMVIFFENNTTKIYLIIANVVLVVFAIWFSNAGLLPFLKLGDFVLFAVLALLLAVYRPGWMFVLFVGAIVLENVNLIPKNLGFELRPYQFFGMLSLLALLIQLATKRLPFSLPKLKWPDLMLIIFGLAGFLSSLASVNKALSFKQALIATSFIAFYFLVRVYVQSLNDLKRVAPFFLSSSVVVVLYGIWQNFLFSRGGNSFEVMPGRPNATFAEPDWLGAYLVFLLAAVLVIVFYQNRKAKKLNCLTYLFLGLIFATLILTVSRSAWIGAAVVTLGYLKLILFYGKSDSLNTKGGFWKKMWLLMKQKWNWRGWLLELLKILAVLVFSLGFIFVFHLTNFQLGSRAASTGGLQKITVACEAGKWAPEKIANIAELANYGCKHINLEEIATEKARGKDVQEVLRPDPNVGIRARIYQTVFEQLKKDPVLGIGWGSISSVLGNDQSGTALNASNLFLETWLGAGLLGILALLGMLGFLASFAIYRLVKAGVFEIGAVFVVLVLLAVVVPNLFNAGIFLGFFWVFLGIAVGLLLEKK